MHLGGPCLLLHPRWIPGRGAISGCCDVATVEKNGWSNFPGPEPRLWLPIGIFLIFQGVLIFALIRLRQPEANRVSMFQGGTSCRPGMDFGRWLRHAYQCRN